MTQTTQLTIAATAASFDRSAPGAIFAIVGDDHNIHCLDESQLNEWFVSLTPEEKGDLYEQFMESDILDNAPAVLGAASFLPEATYGRCHYCGCTDAAACQPACWWIDATHTLCSNPACVDQFNAEMAGHATPLVEGIKAIHALQQLTHAPLTLVGKEARNASL